MEHVRAGIRAFSGLSARRKAVVVASVCLIAALVAALCISIGIRSNMQRKYTAARNQAGEALYSNLYILMQTFDMTGVPNADVQNVILPQMRDYYMASITLNTLLSKTYGPRYAVLGEADLNNLNSAFTAYEKAFASNSPTDLAQADMRACMTRIRELLSARYSQGVLKAAR